ncbi:unnamed protein product, partial [Coccothraustes coccothraustes]
SSLGKPIFPSSAFGDACGSGGAAAAWSRGTTDAAACSVGGGSAVAWAGGTPTLEGDPSVACACAGSGGYGATSVGFSGSQQAASLAKWDI